MYSYVFHNFSLIPLRSNLGEVEQTENKKIEKCNSKQRFQQPTL